MIASKREARRILANFLMNPNAAESREAVEEALDYLKEAGIWPEEIDEAGSSVRSRGRKPTGRN